MRRRIPAFSLLGLSLFVSLSVSSAQESKVIKLPEPQTEGGMPLMEALKARQSSRQFDTEKKLPMQVLSNLLWAANGINRPDGKRTAPSAINWRNIDIYVATAEGLYLYDPQQQALKVLLTEDVRAATGMQDFVKVAPLNLVYVADLSRAKMPKDIPRNLGIEPSKVKTPKGVSGDSASLMWCAAGVGFISQNVYLYCASEGLATVVRGMFDMEALGKVLSLRPDQRIILTQSVGYPRKK